MQYVKHESERIYQFSNALLKAFVENAFQILGTIGIWLTNKLKVLQQ
jgi:hypothetical protein